MMNYNIKFLKQPNYLHQLVRYPANNPLLITADHKAFNYIRRLRGLCLLCDNTLASYEMSCCFGREVWILYSSSSYFQHAMLLGRTAQLNGASKTLVILIHVTSYCGVTYVRK